MIEINSRIIEFKNTNKKLNLIFINLSSSLLVYIPILS